MYMTEYFTHLINIFLLQPTDGEADDAAAEERALTVHSLCCAALPPLHVPAH